MTNLSQQYGVHFLQSFVQIFEHKQQESHLDIIEKANTQILNQSAQQIMKKSDSSKEIQLKKGFQKIGEEIGSQILEELCNPDSLNLQQLIGNLNDFASVLFEKGIFSERRFKQVSDAISLNKPYDNLTSLTLGQSINILKWQVIVQFFSYMITLYNNNKKVFQQVYYDDKLRQCLMYLKGEQDSLKEISNVSFDKNQKLGYRNILKYVSFQTLACVLQLRLQVIVTGVNKQQQTQHSQKVIQSDVERVFGFLDVGDILQKRNLWQQLQMYFRRQFILNNSSLPSTNKPLIGYLNLGLVIESLQFQSLNSCLRFAGELLQFIFSQLDSGKAKQRTEMISLVVLLHLNKVMWFLRIIKKNSYHGYSQDHLTSQPSVLNSVNIIHQSRRSILGKGLTSTSKIQFINSQSHQSIQTSNFLDEESIFLNLLDERVGKIVHRFMDKYKFLKDEQDAIEKIYQPIGQIFAGKIPLTHGNNEHFSSYSIHSFKKLKTVNLTDDQSKLLFAMLTNNMKNLFKSLPINYLQLFTLAKAIFVETQLRQKIQNKRQSIQNKLVKTELLKQFHQNLLTNQPSIKSIKILTKFSLQKYKNKSQQSKKTTQISKNMYLPTLKPNINVQIENRLKLKQLKRSSSIKDQSFFMTREDKKQQKISKVSNINSKNIQIGSAIKSKKNILIPSISNEKLARQKKSISLPSKVKISTNYDIGSRFDRISFYQSTKNSVMNRKFSYEMITCKRKKSQDQQGILWKQSPRKINQSKKLTKLQTLQTKKPTTPLKKDESPKPIVGNSKRRQSTILQSNIEMRKLTLNQKASQLRKSRDQLFSIRKKSTSIQSRKSTEIDRDNIFIKSINTILENFKYLKQQKSQRGLLKLQRKAEREKKHDYEDKSAINQSEEVNIQTLKYEDASEILTSLEIYLRGCLQQARYQQVVERKYPFYLQLQQLNLYEQNETDLIFFFKIVRIKRHSVRKRVFSSGLQKYWNTFQYFLQINDQTIAIDIEQKELVEKHITLREYIIREVENLSKCSVEKIFMKGFQYHMVGDLGGNIQHYTVKMIVWDPQCQRKLKLQQQNYQQKRQKIINQGQTSVQRIQKYPFMKKYYQNTNIAQLIGLKPQKNTVDRVQLYISKQFTFKNQLKPIPQFVQTLLIDPLNQYMVDWAADLVPKAQQICEQLGKTIKTFQKRERKIYHIYFLNRSYQKLSKFKHIIKRVESKYPRNMIKQSEQHRDNQFHFEQEFIQSVEILEFMCKNLIFNKKYIIFNIKILRLAQQEANQFKDYLMIEQKNSNFGNHKRIFFVFPLIIQHHFHLQPKLNENDIKRNIQRAKYKQLIRQISREVSLKNLSNFLINKKMIQIGNWSDTMFNKLLLMYPYVTVMKRIAVENQGSMGRQNSPNNKRQSFIKRRTIIKNAAESQLPRKFYVYATIKIFIIDRNSLVIGVVQISGQLFFFNCTFQYLNKKMEKLKFTNLFRNGLGKGPTQVSINDWRTSMRSGIGSHNMDHKIKGNGRLQWKLSIKKMLTQEQNHSVQKIKHSKSPSIRQSIKSSSFNSTFKSIRRNYNITMSDQHKMTEFKQKFKMIFKHGCELTIKVNQNEENQQQKRMTTDNYQSKYSLAVAIDGEAIKVTQCKYYWWDVVPETGEECVNFRLRDDSLMLVKLSFNGNFYIRKSNKIKINYFQNYLKLVQQKRLKYKGAGMSSMIMNQDKLIYYESYKVFVQNLQRYHFVFSTDWVLSKIRLDHIKDCGYHVNVMNLDADGDGKQSLHKGQQNQGINFELHTSELSNVDIPHMQLSKKMLNNTHFKKRMRSILDYQMDSILRKQ